MIDVAILEEIAEIFGSLRDVDSALRGFLALAKRVSGADNGGIYLRDEHGGGYRRWAETADTPLLPVPADLVELVFAGADHRTLSLDDARLDSYEAVKAARAGGVHAAMGLALRDRGELMGVLGLGFASLDAIDQDMVRTLLSVARFPATAIAHARTQELSDRRALLANVLRRFGETALATVDEPALQRLILDTALELTASDQASITEVRGDRVRMIAGVGKDEPLVGTEAPVALMAEALAAEAPLVVNDVETANPEQLLVKLAKKTGARSFMVLAMRRPARVFGHLFAGAPRAFAYRDEEVEAMRILASMAAAVLEQRHASALAELQARRLAAAVEHLPMCIELFAAAGERTLCNAAARQLRERLAVASGTATAPFGDLTLLSLDGQPLAPEALPTAIALRGEQPLPREVVLAAPDGARVATVLMAAAPLPRDDGSLESVVLGWQDVSALHELAQEKDRFLRVAAHELRTPITALSATTQLLEIDPGLLEDTTQRGRLLSRVRRQSDRLKRLVEQLLESVRAQAGEVPLQRADVDLVRLCQDVVETTMPAGGPRAVVQAAGEVIGRCDPLRIEQVVTNLLSNAVRYGGGEVVVGVEGRVGRARISVSDNGIGIPEEQRAMLFTPFFRGRNAPARAAGGLGLGLHIAREIVERHGGTISVESRENQGTTFVVELPTA